MINIVYWCALFPSIVHDRRYMTSWVDIVQAIGAHFAPFVLMLVELHNNLVSVWNFAHLSTVGIVLASYLVLNAEYTVSK
jgi:hypothetical protein